MFDNRSGHRMFAARLGSSDDCQKTTKSVRGLVGGEQKDVGDVRYAVRHCSSLVEYQRVHLVA